MDSEWDETYDVVVVGAGTGLFAAISAAETELRVLVVEKSPVFGGSVAMSAGIIWMPGNEVLEKARTGDTPERAATYLDTLVGESAPRPRRVSFLQYAPAAADTLRRTTPLMFMHIPGYPDHHAHLDGASIVGRAIEAKPFNRAVLGADRRRVRPSTVAAPLPMPITSVDYKWLVLLARVPWQAVPRAAWRLLQGIGGKGLGRDVVAAGQALAAGLLAGAHRTGVEMWLESPLVDLVSDDDRVHGVVVERAGRPIRVAATRGVILAGGGFENNPALRREHQAAELRHGWSFNAAENTGDVLTIARRHDAGLSNMDQSWWSPGIAPAEEDGPATFMLAERSQPGSMMVNTIGRRFVNESCDHMTAGQTMLGLAGGGDVHVPAWLIFDAKYRNSHVFAGRFPPGFPLPRSWYSAGIAHKAPTIDALAKKRSMPHLVEEVARFNAGAFHGQDVDFGRGDRSTTGTGEIPPTLPTPRYVP
ncbi:MAG: FAD-binding protein [Arachnia sp.]